MHQLFCIGRLSCSTSFCNPAINRSTVNSHCSLESPQLLAVTDSNWIYTYWNNHIVHTLLWRRVPITITPTNNIQYSQRMPLGLQHLISNEDYCKLSLVRSVQSAYLQICMHKNECHRLPALYFILYAFSTGHATEMFAGKNNIPTILKAIQWIR